MLRGLKFGIIKYAGILSLCAVIFCNNTVYANDTSLSGPAYDTEEKDEAKIECSLATGYNPEHREILDRFCQKIASASIDELKHGFKITKRVGSTDDLMNYVQMINYIGYLPSTTYINVDDNYRYKVFWEIDDTEYEKIYNSIREAESKFDSFISGYEATLEDIKDIYKKITFIPYDYQGIPGTNNIYGALVQNMTRCGGKAMLFRKALTELGVECYTVIGYTAGGEYHAWNSFSLDDKIYTCDCTMSKAYKYTDLYKYFKEDGSMTFGDGRVIENIY